MFKEKMLYTMWTSQVQQLLFTFCAKMLSEIIIHAFFAFHIIIIIYTIFGKNNKNNITSPTLALI